MRNSVLRSYGREPISGRGLATLALLALVAARAAGQETLEPETLARIRAEARQGSQVLETARHLCDEIGPRLTGSAEMRKAASWTRERLDAWGLNAARVEEWGPFGKAWTIEGVAVNLLEPQRTPLSALPKAWTRGTPGVVRGGAALWTGSVPAEPGALARERKRLKGKVVFLADGTTGTTVCGRAARRRLSAEELRELEHAGPGIVPATDPNAWLQLVRSRQQQQRLFEDAGVLAVIESGRRSEGALVMAQPGDRIGLQGPAGVPQLVMSAEHFGRIVRLLQRGTDVRLELDVRTRFSLEIQQGMNVLAELPGTDRRDEVVLVGAHLDSWHGGQGATDNAAGVATAMEAVRILRALALKPRRTIRIALWSGEELGLLGSAAYVREHLGWRAEPDDPIQRALPAFMRSTGGELHTRPAHARLSAYFNLDYGTGRIRGVFLGENRSAAPLLATWLRPLANLGATTVSPRSLIGSDHQSFESVGLPAFAFIHDDLDYLSVTHHSTSDVFDCLELDDLVQAATVAATIVYQAAQHPTLVPRPSLTHQ
jgi:carboxypeptidase Q